MILLSIFSYYSIFSKDCIGLNLTETAYFSYFEFILGYRHIFAAIFRNTIFFKYFKIIENLYFIFGYHMTLYCLNADQRKFYQKK